MERLTKRIREYVYYTQGKYAETIPFEMETEDVRKVMHKLAEYEDAEEQGLLLRMELKVGDTFWELNDNFLEPTIYPRKAHSLQHVLYCMDRLGKVTFLIKEEAEQKLASMQKGE